MFASTVTRIPWIIVLLPFVIANPTFDSYQDALKKYTDWHNKNGLGAVQQQGSQVERNVGQHNVVQSAIFVPHRPRDGGQRFVIQDTDSLLLENEISGPELFRDTRQPHQSSYQIGLGGKEYVTSLGTPLYKVKKRFPLGYGRKKREAPQDSPWVLLDPATGRPVKQRNQARPNRGSNTDRQSYYGSIDTNSGFHTYIDADGVPIYKKRKQNPLGYGK